MTTVASRRTPSTISSGDVSPWSPAGTPPPARPGTRPDPVRFRTPAPRARSGQVTVHRRAGPGGGRGAAPIACMPPRASRVTELRQQPVQGGQQRAPQPQLGRRCGGAADGEIKGSAGGGLRAAGTEVVERLGHAQRASAGPQRTGRRPGAGHHRLGQRAEVHHARRGRPSPAGGLLTVDAQVAGEVVLEHERTVAARVPGAPAAVRSRAHRRSGSRRAAAPRPDARPSRPARRRSRSVRSPSASAALRWIARPWLRATAIRPA